MPRRAELAAGRLLAYHGITSPPVDPEALAVADGVLVVRRHFEDADVSGILFRDDDHHVVGVNSAHPLVRQRFTIAHELGHRALHPGRELILDVPVRVNLRDRTSSMASDIEEIEDSISCKCAWLLDGPVGQLVRPVRELCGIKECLRVPADLRRDACLHPDPPDQDARPIKRQRRVSVRREDLQWVRPASRPPTKVFLPIKQSARTATNLAAGTANRRTVAQIGQWRKQQADLDGK